MKKVPTAILLGYLAISFGCVTFAWMNEPTPPTGKVGVIEFDADDDEKGTLRIQTRAITCKAYALDETIDEYVDLDSYTLDTLFSRSSFIPGKYIQLKFSFTNSSDAITDVSLLAYDITTSNMAILDYIYFGVNMEVTPDVTVSYESILGTYTSLSGCEAQANGKYSKRLIEKMHLVPTELDDTMDFYCYVLLSKNADNTLQEVSFSMGHFRIIL